MITRDKANTFWNVVQARVGITKARAKREISLHTNVHTDIHSKDVWLMISKLNLSLKHSNQVSIIVVIFIAPLFDH